MNRKISIQYCYLKYAPLHKIHLAATKSRCQTVAVFSSCLVLKYFTTFSICRINVCDTTSLAGSNCNISYELYLVPVATRVPIESLELHIFAIFDSFLKAFTNLQTPGHRICLRMFICRDQSEHISGLRMWLYQLQTFSACSK